VIRHDIKGKTTTLTGISQSSTLQTRREDTTVQDRFRDQPIIEEFKRRIEQRFPGELVRLVVYGSQARGEATVESDIDVLAVVRSEDWKLGDEIRGIGYELEIAQGLVLSIQVMGQRYYEDLKARGSTFLTNVEREGLPV
jgi:predicted nucleotidyltransferase